MSGSRAIISSAVTIRSFADFPPARSAKMSVPPAVSISSDTQAMPEIMGSSHSSKYTRGRRANCAARRREAASPASSSPARWSALLAAPERLARWNFRRPDFEKSGSHETPHWRKTDSNPRSRDRDDGLRSNSPPDLFPERDPRSESLRSTCMSFSLVNSAVQRPEAEGKAAPFHEAGEWLCNRPSGISRIASSPGNSRRVETTGPDGYRRSIPSLPY
jgi:hypothetical protein